MWQWRNVNLYSTGAAFFRLGFAVLFLSAGVNTGEETITDIARDLVAAGSFTSLPRRDLFLHAYAITSTAVFIGSGLLLLVNRLVVPSYVVTGALYVTLTVWQVMNRIDPNAASQYVPTFVVLLVAIVLERHARSVSPVLPPPHRPPGVIALPPPAR